MLACFDRIEALINGDTALNGDPFFIQFAQKYRVLLRGALLDTNRLAAIRERLSKAIALFERENVDSGVLRRLLEGELMRM